MATIITTEIAERILSSRLIISAPGTYKNVPVQNVNLVENMTPSEAVNKMIEEGVYALLSLQAMSEEDAEAADEALEMEDIEGAIKNNNFSVRCMDEDKCPTPGENLTVVIKQSMTGKLVASKYSIQAAAVAERRQFGSLRKKNLPTLTEEEEEEEEEVVIKKAPAKKVVAKK